ncbi:MAG: GAF domain-containing protein [Anaerolineales bacterium]|nr:GAF domain-containing protein [Anaerolineales bacterium]
MNQANQLNYSYNQWRSSFLRTTLLVASVFGLIAIVPNIISSALVFKIIYSVVYLALLAVSFLKVNDEIRASVLVGLVFIVSVSGFPESGSIGSGRLFLLGAISLACLLFSWKAGAVIFGAGSVAYAFFGWLILTQRITLIDPTVQAGDAVFWIGNYASLLILSALIIVGIGLSQSEYRRSEQRAKELLTELSEERSALEQRVEERTRNLDRLTTQLQAVAEVGKSITSYRNLSELLQSACFLIHDKFGYYHVGIFLLDERKQYAVLAAANSEGGQRMLERGHQLKIGETGIVGYVSENLEARIALDVGDDAVFFNNPDLPDTRSEMALPIVSSGQILGVLDVQSVEPNAFVQDDIETLQTLAEQLAIAIQNANLFNETNKALEATRATYGQLSREAWNYILRTQARVGFLATPPTTIRIQSETLEDSVSKAIQMGDIIHGGDNLTIGVPVKIRGQVIGAIRLKKSEIADAWSQEEINLAISLADQLSGALESARLYNESQRRAYRESILSDISARITASPSREAIIRETVQELGQSFANVSVAFQLLERGNE